MTTASATLMVKLGRIVRSWRKRIAVIVAGVVMPWMMGWWTQRHLQWRGWQWYVHMQWTIKVADLCREPAMLGRSISRTNLGGVEGAPQESPKHSSELTSESKPARAAGCCWYLSISFVILSTTSHTKMEKGFFPSSAIWSFSTTHRRITFQAGLLKADSESMTIFLSDVRPKSNCYPHLWWDRARSQRWHIVSQNSSCVPPSTIRSQIRMLPVQQA